MTAATQPFMSQRYNAGSANLFPRDESFQVGRNLGDILQAWHLVYNVYHENGLIDANPHRIHTMKPVIGSRTAVCLSRQRGQVQATISAVMDGPNGLPLDKVYENELDHMRAEGRVLAEVCLLAHRWQTTAGRREVALRDENHLVRHKLTIINLMRMVFAFVDGHGCTDVVVGVHPKHAPFYARAFRFRRISDVRTYATVNHRPVVLLRAAREDVFAGTVWPYALEYFTQHPLAYETFEQRYAFDPEDLTTPTAAPLRAFLTMQEKLEQLLASA